MAASPEKNYKAVLAEFRTYLRLERAMSPNTVSGYCTDVEKFLEYLEVVGVDSPEKATGDNLTGYISALNEKELSKRSQARTISALKSFFRYMEQEKTIDENPCDRLDTPKLQRYLPTVLSVEEVERIIAAVDLSLPEGHRNKAMIEMLYGCGLRVSELVNLRISDCFFEEQFIRVIGKGDKQRLVPVGGPAIKAVKLYLQGRALQPVARGCEDVLFLNRRGGKISRNMVFLIVRELSEAAGIGKEISPHTFRHSFATHLVENGADLRVVQQMLGHASILTTEIYTHIDTAKWQATILKFHPVRND